MLGNGLRVGLVYRFKTRVADFDDGGLLYAGIVGAQGWLCDAGP